MTQKKFDEFTDEELLIEKKKMKQSKIFHAGLIGFLIGVISFGTVAWLMNPEKQFGFLIPMLFPIYFIYKLIKSPNKYADLEIVLRERNL